MVKKFIYIILLLIVSSSCEEMYYADINDVENKVVIEALITNDTDVNFVSITKTKDFYDESYFTPKVTGATVSLACEDGEIYDGIELSDGYFTINHAAVPGKAYWLVLNIEGETYESEVEVMPVIPEFDSLYAKSDTLIETRYTYNGDSYDVKLSGISSFVDLPIDENLSKYRFSFVTALEWRIDPVSPFGGVTYGWHRVDVDGPFNIASRSTYSSSNEISMHKFLFLENDLRRLIDPDDYNAGAYMVGWIVEVDQFGISDKTYNFYDSANGQLEADGKLFDPVYSQLESNFICTSNPEKEVIGYFELSSHRYFRFFTKCNLGSSNVRIELTDNTNEIPPSNVIEANDNPAFWEY